MDDDELRAFMRAHAQQIEAQGQQIKELTSFVRTLAPTQQAVSPLTVNDVWTDYAKAIADRSWATNVRDLMVAPLAHFGEKRIADLKRSDWSFYRDNVRKKQTTRMGRAPGATTINLELCRMKTILNWAVNEEKIKENPLAKVKPEPKRNARETTISEDGIERLLNESSPLLRAFILVGVDSGMRKGEVLSLRWSQINKTGRLTVSWTIAKTKRTRQVRLSERALAALDELPQGFGGYVFENSKTALPFSETHMWDLFRNACVEAKLEAAAGDERVHYHDSRHTFVTRTVERGTPLAVAMRAAGHVTLAQVSRYFHLEEAALDEMKKRNDDAINGGTRIGPKRAESRTDLKKAVDG